MATEARIRFGLTRSGVACCLMTVNLTGVRPSRLALSRPRFAASALTPDVAPVWALQADKGGLEAVAHRLEQIGLRYSNCQSAGPRSNPSIPPRRVSPPIFAQI